MRAKKKAPGKGFSLRASLVLALGLVLAALLAVMGYYIFGVRDTARRQAEESFQNLTEASRAQLERLLETSQKAAQTASYSAASQRFLLSEIPGDVIDAKSLAADVMDYVETLGDGFVDIVLLSVRGRKLSATNSYTDIVREAMAQSGIGEDLTFTQPVYSPVIEADGKQYIVYLTPVYGSIDGYRYRQNPILCGVVYDVETLSGSLIPASYEAGTAFLSAGTEVFGGTRPLAKAEENALPEIAEGVGSLFIGGERYLTGRVTVEGPGWELIYLVPESAAVSAIDQMRSLVVMLILLTALLSLAVMVGILLGVRRDIGRLSEDIAGLGTASGPVRQPAMKELRPVSGVLNETMERLQNAMQEEKRLTRLTYEAELAQSRAEMLAYRSQINPHFLFNTLESARSLAHRYHAAPVEQLVGGMSQMFRYSIYAPPIVPLEEELGQLGGYLAVMEVRFPGRFAVLEDIAPETLDWPVLPMLLQPLCENALTHAFNGRRGKLLVQTFVEAGRLHVRIADNGKGISEEQLRQILWKMKNTDGETADVAEKEWDFGVPKGSIGLPNIYRRLKLTFGDHAHLLLRSKEGYYTVAELVIPRGHIRAERLG